MQHDELLLPLSILAICGICTLVARSPCSHSVGVALLQCVVLRMLPTGPAPLGKHHDHSNGIHYTDNGHGGARASGVSEHRCCKLEMQDIGLGCPWQGFGSQLVTRKA
jgi:hypothetical protein